jgi:ESCRT-II complex subunit VPS36
LLDFDSGQLYLTTHRILWVGKTAIQIALKDVVSFHTQPAFLRSSEKVILNVQPPQISLPLELWQCEICSHNNTGSHLRCVQCGVSRLKVKPCPVCTFGNKVTNLNCSMCSANLIENTNPSKTGVIKLSLRAGGSLNEFDSLLKAALNTKAWDAVVLGIDYDSSLAQSSGGIGGVHQLMNSVALTNDNFNRNIESAFKDLNSLMIDVKQMVKIAKSLSLKCSVGTSPEALLFHSYLVELGIEQPVTRETSGNFYSQEIAKELNDFLKLLFAKQSITSITISDLYCLFNRARGVCKTV